MRKLAVVVALINKWVSYEILFKSNFLKKSQAWDAFQSLKTTVIMGFVIVGLDCIITSEDVACT